MVGNWDMLSGANLVLCVIILILGCIGYIRTKVRTPFYIGAAFGLFAVSHLMALFGVEKNFEITVVLVRIFGYVIVALTLLKTEYK